MKALSVLQPWAWAIVSGPKDVENRVWRPPAEMIGQRIAIHASKKKPDQEFTVHVAYCHGIELPPTSYLALGAIVGTAILSGVRSDREPYDPAFRWHERGLWGWLLTDRHALKTPIPYKGALGLWTVPAAIAAQLEEVTP